jgi:hypothetical protein
MKKSDYSISQSVNKFVNQLKKNQYVVQIMTVGNETIILYEDWEHEPIKNTESLFKEYKKRAKTDAEKKAMSDARKGIPKSMEVRKKISDAMKNKEFSEVHKMKISNAKLEYYKNKKLDEQK